ncbi:MAG: dihydropteroate synthase [Actinobacteria bacterium]|nr:dihydropteroate synthase [Actinomycetota bacterium]
MGIVNVTPDSFYDRGETAEVDAAVDRALRLVAEGADIVDIGGIKGGPGPAVDVAEERRRVVPVIEAVRGRSDVVISVDTFRAPIADAALEAGADLVNDVTGGHDPTMLETVAARGAGYVAMHHGGEPRTRPSRRGYRPDVTTVVVEHCRELANRAIDVGVAPDRIVVDPGHDFQKTTYHSLELTRRLPELAALGYPVLVALSNKDFIGETLDAPLDRRVDGSLAAAVFAITRGARIVRVHEVARTVDAVRMTESLLGWRPPAVAVRGLE